jgi:putative intracellular protease/amidase
MLYEKRVLIVMSSHKVIGMSGMQGGTWLDEVATPYYMFQEEKCEVVLASPKGGKAPLEIRSFKQDFYTDNADRFLKDPVAQYALENTTPLELIDYEYFDAILVPGGYGLLWDLASNQKLVEMLSKAYESKKVLGFICHGPAVLRDVKTSRGEPLVKGLNITGFTNSQDKALNLLNHLLFSLEDDLKMRGARFESVEDWKAKAVVAGNLITGQNPNSASPVTQEMINILKR